MDKTFLEKRIEEKAQARVDKDINNFRDFVSNNPILCNLQIKLNDKFVYIEHMLMNGVSIAFQENSNILDVKKELLKKYIKDETDILLSKMVDLGHFMSNN